MRIFVAMWQFALSKATRVAFDKPDCHDRNQNGNLACRMPCAWHSTSQIATTEGRRHGPMAGRHIFAANESIFVIHSAIDSPALGGLKTGWVLANSTARQTEV
jgi:hypothetical protein